MAIKKGLSECFRSPEILFTGTSKKQVVFKKLTSKIEIGQKSDTSFIITIASYEEVVLRFSDAWIF